MQVCVVQRVLADQQPVAIELGPQGIHRLPRRRPGRLAAVRLVRTRARLRRPPRAAARRTGCVCVCVCVLLRDQQACRHWRGPIGSIL